MREYGATPFEKVGLPELYVVLPSCPALSGALFVYNPAKLYSAADGRSVVRRQNKKAGIQYTKTAEEVLWFILMEFFYRL